jgi:hypothetical protein
MWRERVWLRFQVALLESLFLWWVWPLAVQATKLLACRGEAMELIMLVQRVS